MKKTLIVIGFLGVFVLTLGFAGYSYAQSQGETVRDLVSGTFNPDLQATDDNPDDYPRRDGVLSAYFHDAVAEAFGLTAEELTAERDAGNTLLDIAEAQGLSIEAYQAKFDEAWDTAIENALADGAITEEQANIIGDRSPNGFQGLGVQEHGQGPDFGRNRFDDGVRPGFAGDGIVHDIYADAMESILGLTPEELHAQIQDGTTFQEILDANGLTLEEYHELMAAAVTSAINQAVIDGMLTQEQADRILQMLDRIEGFGPHPGFGPGPDFGPGMEKGPGSGFRPDTPQNPGFRPENCQSPGGQNGQGSGNG